MGWNSKNDKIIKRVAKETGYSPKVIRKIVKFFFVGIRRILNKGGEVNLRGLFVLRIRPYYKRKLKKDPNYNLFSRESGNKRKRGKNG